MTSPGRDRREVPNFSARAALRRGTTALPTQAVPTHPRRLRRAVKGLLKISVWVAAGGLVYYLLCALEFGLYRLLRWAL